MIYITGDTHGDWMSRLNTHNFPEQKSLSKKDYVIICGDFGLWHDTPSERYALKWLENKTFTTLFCEGNHDNYDRLNSIPITKWHGGQIHKISNSIFHLLRGNIFNIDSKDFFVFGGASSHDISDGILEIGDERIKRWKNDIEKMYRVNHISWWKEELPSVNEMQTGIENLNRINNKVDYVITHSPYSSIYNFDEYISKNYKNDILTEYLQRIKESIAYNHWFFGHLHEDKIFDFDNSTCVYKKIIRLD